jgi:hypothetical protein
MDKFTITFADGVTIDVEANNGTEAKATARTQRGVKKSECKIANVAPAEAPAPPAADDAPSQRW